MSGRSVYRKDAVLHSVQPEALDDLPRVTAPHERIFRAVFLALCLALAVWAALVF